MLDYSINVLDILDLDEEELDSVSGAIFAIPWQKVGQAVLEGGEAAYNFAGGFYEGFTSF